MKIRRKKMKKELNEPDIAKEIFDELDAAIEKCIFANPSTWNSSQFRRYYNTIKESWLGERDE